MTDPLADPLELAFRELEAEVRQRDCAHASRIEMTECGDRERVWLCADCGVIRARFEVVESGRGYEIVTRP